MEKRERSCSVIILGSLQVFIGLGAVGGGIMLISDPSGGGLGIPVELLEGSPFSDYLIPGLVLLAFNGFGSVFGSILTFRRHRFCSLTAAALGVFLMAWIVVQVMIFNSIHWVHATYFTLGLVELILGILIRKDLNKKFQGIIHN